jgi:hypothetical protein
MADSDGILGKRVDLAARRITIQDSTGSIFGMRKPGYLDVRDSAIVLEVAMVSSPAIWDVYFPARISVIANPKKIEKLKTW